jgi:hypothetical protein
MTITTPAGAKVRCTSNRRFFCIVEHVEASGEVSASVELRTSNLDTARTHLRRKGNSLRVDGSRSVRHIFDSFRKEVVR